MHSVPLHPTTAPLTPAAYLQTASMGFYFCPRWFRRYRRSHSPPLATIDELSASDQLPEGMPGSKRHRRNSSGGLSHKIRKRLSHDSTKLGTRSSLFGLSSRPTHRPVAANDVGSSLMSEKGYDSDAQYISTSKHAAGQPSIRSRILGRVSPLGQSCEPFNAAPNKESLETPRQTRPAGGSRFIEHSDVDTSQPEGQILDGTERVILDSQQMPHAGVPTAEPVQRRLGSPLPGYLPDYSTELRSKEPMCVIHESDQPQPDNDAAKATVSVNSEDITLHDAAPMSAGTSSIPTVAPQLPCTTSADSVADSYGELSVRKKCQRFGIDQRLEDFSLHLGEMDIPGALASSSTSPVILSRDQSCHGSGRDEESTAHPSQQHAHPVRSRLRARTWNSGEPDANSPRAASSSYSRRTSFSSGRSRHRFESRIFSHLYHTPSGGITECPSAAEDSVSSFKSQGTPNATGTGVQREIDDGLLKYRRISSFLSDSRSESSSTRRVSIGWMSGGRRLGYGYTLISGDDEERQSSQSTVGSEGQKETVTVNGKSDKEGHSEQKNTEGPSPGLGKSILDIFKTVNRFNFRHAPSKSTVKNDINGKPDSNPVAALFRSSSTRNKGSTGQATATDSKAPSKDLAVGEKPLRDTPDTQIGAQSPVERGGSLARGSSLRRAKTLWSRRSVGSGDTSSSSGSNPTPRRSKTQVLKFHNPSRRTALFSDGTGDNLPAFLNTENQNQQSAQLSKDATDQISTPIAKVDHQRRLHRSSSSNSADDWSDTYQDCVELHPIPELRSLSGL